MTMGIVVVASFAARAATRPCATMTSTLSRTSSAAKPGRRSDLAAAQRYSTVRFLPSMYPRSRNPWRNASAAAVYSVGPTGLRSPIRAGRATVWAFATATTPRAVEPKTTRAIANAVAIDRGQHLVNGTRTLFDYAPHPALSPSGARGEG